MFKISTSPVDEIMGELQLYRFKIPCRFAKSLLVEISRISCRTGSYRFVDPNNQGQKATSVFLIKAVHGSKMSSTKLISRNWGSKPRGEHDPPVLTVRIGSRHRMTRCTSSVHRWSLDYPLHRTWNALIKVENWNSPDSSVHGLCWPANFTLLCLLFMFFSFPFSFLTQ